MFDLGLVGIKATLLVYLAETVSHPLVCHAIDYTHPRQVVLVHAAVLEFRIFSPMFGYVACPHIRDYRRASNFRRCCRKWLEQGERTALVEACEKVDPSRQGRIPVGAIGTVLAAVASEVNPHAVMPHATYKT